MKNDKEYIEDLVEIRSLMERSTKFFSLSGLAGILAGIYAISGAYIAAQIFNFNPDGINNYKVEIIPSDMTKVIVLAAIVLLLSIVTAIFFSYQKALKNGERLWNPTARRLIASMTIPLITGGILILILYVNGFIGLMAPLTLIFYGLALYNAGTFTFAEIRGFGLILIVLGLVSVIFIPYSLFLWAIGFGFFHIAYGIYMHFKYER